MASVFGPWDYLSVCLMLVISAVIGVYFRFAGGRQKTTKEFLMAGKDMPIVPVAFSVMASFLSANSVVGLPSETYKFGMYFAYLNIGYIVGSIIAAYVFLPVFFDLGVYTTNEYLEMRFGKVTRTVMSFAFMTQMILYMAVVLFSPSIAMSAVTGWPQWVSILTVGTICTFYCTIGGMKAVLWTDLFQALLMYITAYAVIIRGFTMLGASKTVSIAYEGGRLPFPTFKEDFTTRYTVWNILFLSIILTLCGVGTSQVQIQRLLTVKDISRSRIALFLSMPLSIIFQVGCCFSGAVIYSVYAECDPLQDPSSGIYSHDQILPYFIVQELSTYPGIAGLCVSGVFSASLSTVSSAINSLTAVTMQDLIKPFCAGRKLASEKNSALFAKIISLGYGFLCVGLSFLIANFSGIVEASLVLFGLLGGPVLAVFMLGMLTRRSNEKGVVVGLLIGIVISGWAGFGAMAARVPVVTLPLSTEGCPAPNITGPLNTTLEWTSTIATLNLTDATLDQEERYIFPYYRMSYMWIGPVGWIVTMVIGYVVSLATGSTEKVDEKLLSPVMRIFNKSDDECNKESITKVAVISDKFTEDSKSPVKQKPVDITKL